MPPHSPSRSSSNDIHSERGGNPNPVTTNNTQSQRRVEYYNPDPVARLFAKANEAPVVVEGVHILQLLDHRSNCLCHHQCLFPLIWIGSTSLRKPSEDRRNRRIWNPLHWLCRSQPPYPQIPGYNKDVLKLVIPESRYTQRIPVQIGTSDRDSIKVYHAWRTTEIQ